jgi:UDP-N-acetylmuramate dehydrogenase
MSPFEKALRDALGDARVQSEAPLAPLTTFKVGGPAEWLVTVRTAGEISAALALAREHRVVVTVIGGGSNLLVADAGVRGLVVRIHGGDIRMLDASTVRADAGVTINGLVRWTIARGVAGLEAWAGTPGTVGGAIYGNAHFQGRLISELVKSVTLVDRRGAIVEAPAADMQFAYDYSRLHETGEIVVSADFHARPGDPEALRTTARESLAYRKRTQPLEKASAGCIFQNPDPSREALPPGIPPSAGALVDRAGLKEAAEGGAHVAARHGNFIVNDGRATARDIAVLIERCREEVRRRSGVELRDEIVRVGFEADSDRARARKGPDVDPQS